MENGGIAKMTPEQYEQIGNIYQAALGRAPAERTAFLAAACGVDETLRREVESLIAAHERAGDFIEHSPDDLAAGWQAAVGAPPQKNFGRYRLMSLLGKGGMGEVYRAKHRLLARPAAVKLISPTALKGVSAEENRVVIERFRREAEAAATLRSPHTIELYDYGVAEDGTFYYVMEILDGIDFHQLVQLHGALPAERVVHLLSQACDSLGEAHLSGLVHRDVKPSNLFACRMGLKVDYVKVLDFGLVKSDPAHAENQVEITTAGSVSGTPAFMAPESVSGIGSVGPAADVYALGCVAYWLLTGQNVFKAPNPMMMMVQHVQAAPVPPSLKAPHPVPHDLEALVMKCLSKDPVDRPADAAELARLLSELRVAMPWTDARAQQWWSSTFGGESSANRTGSIMIQ